MSLKVRILQFLNYFNSSDCKTQQLFNGMAFYFGPKGMSGRMCDSAVWSY